MCRVLFNDAFLVVKSFFFFLVKVKSTRRRGTARGRKEYVEQLVWYDYERQGWCRWMVVGADGVGSVSEIKCNVGS